MQVYVSTWLDSDVLQQAVNLKWVYLALGDVEFLEGIQIPSLVRIPTAAGISANGVAEHVLGLMVALDRRFDLVFKRQRD